MIDIKIYGTGTPGQQLAKSKLVSSLVDANIEYNLTEVNDISEFIKDGVVSVPAIKVNDSELFEIRPNGQYTQSLRECIQGILKIVKYGTMQQYIVPTDFSETSFNAYNYANQLAKLDGGYINLTHVYYPTSVDVNQYTILSNEVETVHKSKLDNYVKSLNQDWFGNFIVEPFVDSTFEIGFPKLSIIELSKQNHTSIVMGTTGEGDTFKKVFGSLTMDLVDECYAPLFLVPPNCHFEAGGIVTYLSEDIKNDAEHFLYVADLASKMKSTMRIVHYSKERDDKFNTEDCQALIKNYYPELDFNIEIIMIDDVFKQIENEIIGDQNALLAMSTKHRNIFQSLFHKSASEFVAANAKIPILIMSDRVKTHLKEA
ncbi:MAG: universal stress protein [Lewinellaceae bacterium]|nr:universal stress protein [Lewinellaceae bacterium]